MRRFALALAALLAACAPHEPLPAVQAELATFDAALADIEESVNRLKKRFADGDTDFRGRSAIQDLDDWVFTAATRAQLAELRTQAVKSDGVPGARELLERALRLAREEQARSAAIGAYWTRHLPVPYWHRYWDGLYQANGVEREAPDSLLLSLEKTIVESLNKGDFAAAGRDADVFVPVFFESLDRASSRILKVRDPVLVFKPRSTPCPPGAAPDRGRRHPKLSRAESLERYYPQDALERGEAGSVVLRARVDRQGCGRAVTVVVRSGVESLDQAALQWFESAQFSPAWLDGDTIDAELTFKMKFVIQDRSQGPESAGRAVS